jgi:hypothetical protein
VLIDNRGDSRTATAAAARAGLTVVGTEMAGGGAVAIDALALCRRGVRNVLGHLGVLPAPAARPSGNDAKIFKIPPNGFVLATDDGVFEPYTATALKCAPANRPGASIFSPILVGSPFFYAMTRTAYSMACVSRARCGRETAASWSPRPSKATEQPIDTSQGVLGHAWRLRRV